MKFHGGLRMSHMSLENRKTEAVSKKAFFKNNIPFQPLAG